MVSTARSRKAMPNHLDVHHKATIELAFRKIKDRTMLRRGQYAAATLALIVSATVSTTAAFSSTCEFQVAIVVSSRSSPPRGLQRTQHIKIDDREFFSLVSTISFDSMMAIYLGEEDISY